MRHPGILKRGHHASICCTRDRRTNPRSHCPLSRGDAGSRAGCALGWAGDISHHAAVSRRDPKSAGDQNRAVERESAPTTVTFRGAGFFPNPNRARVFWVGIESDANLQHLVNEIGTALAPLGFKREQEEYHPHLTLARAGSGRPQHRPGDKAAPGLQQVRAKLETMPPPDFGTMTANEFILYQSTLTPTGSRYAKLARYPLS